MQKSEFQETVKEAVIDAVNEGLPADDDGTPFTTEINVEEDEISASDALIDEIRGESETTVNIYRLGTGRGKESFLFSASPEDITAKDINERCRDQHGGGDFKMVTRDAQRIVKSARFSVEAVARPEVEKKPEGMGVTELLAIMQSSNTQMMTMFQSTMGAMAEAMKGNNQPAFNPTEATKTIMESVAAIKQLADPPKDTSGKEMVGMLVQGIELASKFGNKDGDTNSYDLLGKALEFLPSLAEAAKNNPSAPPAPGQPGPGQPNPDPDTQASIEREHRMAQDKAQQAHYVAMLLAWAKAGKDTALYADFILDQVGDEKVLAFIGGADAFEKLVAINPEVVMYRPWFEALKAEILNLTTDDDASDTPLEGEVIPAEGEDVQPDGADPGNAGQSTGRNGGST